MSTHRLSEMNIQGKDRILGLEPQFDFYRINKINNIIIELYNSSNSHHLPSISFSIEYIGDNGIYTLLLRLSNFKNLNFPEIQSILFLNELEIRDVSSYMLEGIRYEVQAEFDQSFRCLCYDVSIIEFIKIK